MDAAMGNAGLFSIIWLVNLIGSAIFYSIVLIIAWRLMRAFEKIADRLGQK